MMQRHLALLKFDRLMLRGAPRFIPVLLALGALTACSGQSGRQAGPGSGDEGTGPQILTSDLLPQQEVHTERVTVNWAIVGTFPIRSIVINGEPEDFKTADTVTINREVLLRKTETFLTIVATDAHNEKRERVYVIVNPALPEKDPDEIALPATKLPLAVREQKRVAREIREREATYKSKFSESEYTPWMFEGPLFQAYRDAVAVGRYPVWIEGRSLGIGFRPQYRLVLKVQPREIQNHKAFWNLTAAEYNVLVDRLTADGYEQLFRDVLVSTNDQWRVQTVWRLRAAKK